MPYGSGDSTYAGDGREFSAADLFAGARGGRYTIRDDGSGGLYVTIDDPSHEDYGETFHVTRQG